MIRGRVSLLKAFIAGSLFINGLALGYGALYLMTPQSPAAVDGVSSVDTTLLRQPAPPSTPATQAVVGSLSAVENANAAPVELAPTDAGAMDIVRTPAADDFKQTKPNSELQASSSTQATAPAIAPAKITAQQRRTLDRLLENGDKLAISGAYARALRIFNEVVAIDSSFRRAELNARIAFCSESTGDAATAMHLYQTIADQSDSNQLATVARLGLARTMYRNGDFLLASRLIWKMLLSADRLHATDPAAGDALAAESVYLLSEIRLLQFSQQDDSAIASHDRIAATSVCGPSAAFFRLLIDAPQQQSDNGSIAQAIHYQSANDDQHARQAAWLTPTVEPELDIELVPHLKTARVRCSGTTKLELVRAIAEQSGLTVEFSPAAQSRLATEYPDVQISQIKIDMLLDALLLSSEMVWTTIDRTLQISFVRESAPTAGQSDLAAIQRLLRHCILVYPEHKCASRAALALASVTFWQGQPAVAVQQYAQILRDRDLKRDFPLVRFNMGVCYLKLRDLPAAEQQFQSVIDNSLQGSVLSEAYLHKGILQYERAAAIAAVSNSGSRSSTVQTEINGAIASLSRAVATGRSRRTRMIAAQCLAAAYLGQRNPYAAVKALDASRDLFKSEEEIASAAFLASLARFRIAGRENADATRTLLNAVSRVTPKRFAGMIGYKLISEACKELNLQESALEVLRQTESHAPASRLLYPLAMQRSDWLIEAGQSELALTSLEAIQGDATPMQVDASFSIQALLQTARLHLRSGEFDTAIAQCRQAIELDTDMERKNESLELLGQAFQKQGNHISAAMCFAGLTPVFEDSHE